jgi:DNA polymerase III sliding clamp (beta) subunit (PCNA family)
MNPQYILDVCNIIESRLPCTVTVTLPIDDINSPILIKQNDSTAIEALIMPVTVHEDIRKQLKEED